MKDFLIHSLTWFEKILGNRFRIQERKDGLLLGSMKSLSQRKLFDDHFRNRIKFKDLTTLTIPFDGKQDLILCIGTLPTGAFWIEICWTMGIDIFRTTKETPAGYFSVPEIWQFLPRVRTDLILNQSPKKAIKKISLRSRRTP
jgi:hypothetical protein